MIRKNTDFLVSFHKLEVSGKIMGMVSLKGGSGNYDLNCLHLVGGDKIG